MAERVAVARRAMSGPGGRLESRTAVRILASVLMAGVLDLSPAIAQPTRCRIVCSPELKIEPTFTVENLIGPPTIETLDENGMVVDVGRAQRERVFELIFALDVQTTIPRVGLTLEAIFVPFGDASVNPFTGVSAGELGRSAIRDNGVEIEAELNFSLFDEEQTGGWLSSHVDVVDKFSPAAQPRAGSTYTHKLNFEWDTAVHVFNRLSVGNWLRHVEAEVSLDYVATGLPRAGDIVGGERYVQDASPWSLSVVFVLPLIPLVP